MGLAESVTAILERRGLTALLTVRSVSAVNPDTGEATVTEVSSSVRSSPLLELRRDIDEFGGLPVSARAVLDAVVAPTPGSRLGLSGGVYPVEAVRTVRDASGVVAYIVGLGDARAGS